MLNMKQKNIGATASIYQNFRKILESKAKLGADLELIELTDSIMADADKLFELESEDCSWKQNKHCFFEIDEPAVCISPAECSAGSCPLGEITDLEGE